ncbi:MULTISPECIES: MetQ/NlpA family ABC transporter substrate-binding protein [unclassified Exiguobacterium]|jgi:D-methionine transport system substrate-binding protein|uniref:MetQ/NlpA family ABC transporter substrate-binding protein n=1 Tax=unclassified Exiguobacterium TaxID=2644629 RepID=UPI0006F3AA19|nr:MULTISPECIES: MetQ/NlpA family ABC transporter substrate-binding protein [unclassified Exiguobacterium]KQS39724.1 hypothetical protein ASG02_10055 [Exiguobacterium sp. Leaf196]HAB33886.1 hypothetical protein [Exiguobacterium sp.]
MKKRYAFLATALLGAGILAGCGDSSADEKDKTIKIGATSGPYSDMVKQAIQPQLEKKGYKVEIVEFSDYIQPNIALGSGNIDANLFQHSIYLKTFSKEKKLDLKGLITVPTAPMGLYSKTAKTLDDVKTGAEVATPNDPTNQARALNLLAEQGWIELKPDVDPLTVSEKDIVKNPKKLVIKPLEAAQLPRAIESVDVSAVPGNFALAAKFDLLDALALETMDEQYRNLIAVQTKDADSQVAKDLKTAVESDAFNTVIEKSFKGFSKPNWAN